MRCTDTVRPYAAVRGIPLRTKDGLSEEGYEGDPSRAGRHLERLVERGVAAAVCSHGPVLPQIIASVAELTGTDGSTRLQRAAALGTGEYAVLHVPIEHPESGLVAVEVHGPTA